MNTYRCRMPFACLLAAFILSIAAGCALAQDAEPAEPAGEAPAEAQEKAAEPLPRLVDAVEFNGHYYKVIMVEGPSWQEKKEICEALGGYLCCIETEEEQEFIARLADWRYLSLGATDKEEEGEWKWVNGAPFDYTAWMDGQPNNYGGEEHYLATYDEGLWVDVAAEGRQFWMPRGFICEWESTAAEREAAQEEAKEEAEATEAEEDEEDPQEE